MFEEGPRKSPLKGSRKETDLWKGSKEDLKEGPAEVSRDVSCGISAEIYLWKV